MGKEVVEWHKTLSVSYPLSFMLLVLLCMLSAVPFMLLFVDSIIAFGLMALGMAALLAGVVGFTFCSWLGMVVLLVYVGGLMVMFSYFLAICPNQVVSFWGAGGVGLVSGVMAWAVFDGVGLSSSVSMPLGGLYVGVNIYLLFMLGLVLLLALVVVVKVVELKQGPLRPFMGGKYDMIMLY